MKLPESSEFEVVYKLVPKQDEPQGDMVIEGLAYIHLREREYIGGG